MNTLFQLIPFVVLIVWIIWIREGERENARKVAYQVEQLESKVDCFAIEVVKLCQRIEVVANKVQ